MSDKPDIEAIKARLAELRRADEEYVSVIANRPAMEPEYNYHLRVARREVEAHAPADIAAQPLVLGQQRERLTLTPERLEAAAKAGWQSWTMVVPWEILDSKEQQEWRREARAALLAAGMTEEALQ